LFCIIKATGREDTPFWRQCRGLKVPDSLEQKIELFRHNGCVLQDLEDLFREHSWVAVMLGQGITPTGYDPLVDSLSRSRACANSCGMSRK